MKSIPATRPLVGLLAALCLLLAACGNDDDTALAPATAESTAAHSEEAAPEAADHDHDWRPREPRPTRSTARGTSTSMWTG